MDLYGPLSSESSLASCCRFDLEEKELLMLDRTLKVRLLGILEGETPVDIFFFLDHIVRGRSWSFCADEL